MSSSKTCPYCKSSDLDTDPARGDTVCMGCGSVLEENTIVSEVQVQENADGSSSVVGQFVSSEGSYKPYLAGFQYGMGKESRQITLDKGKQQIREMAGQLNLNKHCTDTAFNFFKMAISKRLSRGRRIVHIVAACLYMTCRTEGTPHMLLDFSDLTQVNVFTLGKTFLLLAKELHINLPVLDPCMYITRFAHRLDFGEKTHEVSVTAMRLVSRMKRDWLHTGRRPSGLCGAALLVASRMHGFRCDVKDIVKVVAIGQDTIRKRLVEFESTPSSQLTISEFMNIDLEAENDPPAFTISRIKAKINQAGGMLSVESEIGKLTTEIDGQLVDKTKEANNTAQKKKLAVLPSPVSGTGNTLEETIGKVPPSPAPPMNSNIPELEQDSGGDPELAIAAGFVHSENPDVFANSLTKQPIVTPASSSGHCDEQLHKKNREERLNGPTPTAASLGLNQSVELSMSTPPPKPQDNDNGELDLTGIDDGEIDKLILSDRESQIKSRIWMMENGEFMKVLEEKRERKRLEEEKKKPRNPKKKVRYKDYYSESRTAGEAIEKLMTRQKLSNKIDYEALRKATSAYSLPAAENPATLNESIDFTSHKLLPINAPIASKTYKRPVQNKPSSSSSASNKRKKIQKDDGGISFGETTTDADKNAPIIEETKIEVVDNNKEEEIKQEEDEIEEEEEYEEEEGLMSASQMLQQAGMSGGFDEDGYGDDDYE